MRSGSGSRPPQVAGVARLPADWRRAATRWLLAEVGRELAFLEREREPLVRRHAGALHPARRTERAQARLAAARALFLASVLYLPALCSLLLAARL